MIRVGSAPLTVTALPIDDDWRQWATCQDEELDLFFPEGPQDYVRAATADAKAICGNCAVVTECRQWALDARIEHGIYGGLDERQRRAILRRTGAIKQRGSGRTKAPCGTRAAYDRHRKYGEDIDELCAAEGRHKPWVGDKPKAAA